MLADGDTFDEDFKERCMAGGATRCRVFERARPDVVAAELAGSELPCSREGEVRPSAPFGDWWDMVEFCTVSGRRAKSVSKHDVGRI